MRTRFAIHVLLPLLLGGLIYICWRDPTLPMFSWFNSVGLGPAIYKVRTVLAPLERRLPLWFEFSIPNATWVYALTSFMALTWNETKSRFKLFWLSSGLILGVGTEVGQLAGLIPGAFDGVDLLLCVLAAVMAWLLTSTFQFTRRLDDVAT